MSEELKDFQTAPTLTLNPFAEEEKAQPEVKKEMTKMIERKSRASVLQKLQEKQRIIKETEKSDSVRKRYVDRDFL